MDMWNRQKYGEINWKFDRSEEYKEFKTISEAEEWGMTHYKEWAESYKGVVQFAKCMRRDFLFPEPVEFYCGTVYRRINSFLRENKDNENGVYRELADTLTLALCSAPRIPDNVILYRQVCDEFIKQLIKSNKEFLPICEDGFMSTSLVKDIVKVEGTSYSNFGNLLKIYVKKGNVGLYADAVTVRSSEVEMLLPPGMYLKLIKYPYRDKESGKMVFECFLDELYLMDDHCKQQTRYSELIKSLRRKRDGGKVEKGHT